MFSTFSVDDPMPVWLSMSVLGRVIARCVTRCVLNISRIRVCTGGPFFLSVHVQKLVLCLVGPSVVELA